MRIISNLLGLVVANLRGVVFLLGLSLLYVGAAGWSYRVANVTLGAVLTVLVVWPYLRRMNDGSTRTPAER